MRNLGILTLAVLALLLLVFLVVIIAREPRSDRVWDEEVAHTTMASLESDGTVTFTNVRDFTYGDGAVVSTDWISGITVHPKDIVAVWFVLEPFAKWKAVGHTFLTFEFVDGAAYSFSVEARREKGEGYSALKGLVREYELTYMWGTERDFVTRRLLYLKHPVRMYPLAVDRERMQRLFVGFVERTNAIAQDPRFYNTLTANCTNVLAEIVNEIKPGTIPLDVSWYLPGYSDLFLMRIGFITVDESIEDTQEKYNLTKSRASILSAASLPRSQFGRTLRDLLPSGSK